MQFAKRKALMDHIFKMNETGIAGPKRPLPSRMGQIRAKITPGQAAQTGPPPDPQSIWRAWILRYLYKFLARCGVWQHHRAAYGSLTCARQSARA
jgi:hypothetical protein